MTKEQRLEKRRKFWAERIIVLATVISDDLEKIDPKRKIIGKKFWRLRDAVRKHALVGRE